MNEKEKYYIAHYKQIYGDNCYNLASGGDGGDVFKYQTKEDKQRFVDKMTLINRQRCSTEEFKNKMREATSKRYENQEERKLHSEKIKETWSDCELRQKQSEKLTEYYLTHEHDCSFNYIPCAFELNGNTIFFNSIKELRMHLTNEYGYNPDRRTFNRLMTLGANGIPYEPYHKNNKKLQILKGMLIYKLDKSVETSGDECSRVEQEIGACSKCETV